MIYILVNPHSGDKRGLEKAYLLCKQHKEENIEIFQTRKIDDEFQQIRAISERFHLGQDRLLVIGGDGTLSKVLKVWPAQEPLAYLPAGSGNDFVRGFGNIASEQVFEAMKKSQTREFYVFKSQNHLLLNSLGIGFDARVIQHSSASKVKNLLNKWRLGKLTYLFFGIQSIFSREGVSLTLSDENGQLEEYHSVFLFVLANNPYFGGGIMVWPTASVETRNLDLVYLKKGHLSHHIIGLLDLILKRHHSSKHLQHKIYSSVNLRCSKPTLAQIDGESVMIESEDFICQKRKIYY